MQPRLAVLGGLSDARQRGLRASQRPIGLDVLGLEALQMSHTARVCYFLAGIVYVSLCLTYTVKTEINAWLCKY